MTERAIFDTRFSGRREGITELSGNEYILLDKTRTPNGISTVDLGNQENLDI